VPNAIWLGAVAVAPAPMALEFAKVAEAPGPTAVALTPVAVAPSPKAAPPFAAVAAAPTATEPVATAPVPIAMELTPVLWLAPIAIAPSALATALAPSAVAPAPLPMLFSPSAVARLPLAFAFVPQPKDDDTGAEAPLLPPVTDLSTDVVVALAFVRTCAVETLMLLTTALGVEVRPVIALANVGVVVPLVKVKKLFAVGAVTPVTTVCGGATVPLTTCAFVSVMVGVGVFVLTKLTAPLPVVVRLLLAKANLVLLGFALGSNAGTMRLLVAPGLRPVTEVVGAVTPVTAVPVTGATPALVKNDCVVAPVTALANVGITPVTTVWPDPPLTPFTTLAKVWFTPVTHVSAEAEANSAA